MAVKCQKPKITGTLSAVAITTNTPGAQILYTTDGTFPAGGSATLYSAPFAVSADTTVRAAAWKSDRQGSDVAEQTF